MKRLNDQELINEIAHLFDLPLDEVMISFRDRILPSIADTAKSSGGSENKWIAKRLYSAHSNYCHRVFKSSSSVFYIQTKRALIFRIALYMLHFEMVSVQKSKNHLEKWLNTFENTSGDNFYSMFGFRINYDRLWSVKFSVEAFEDRSLVLRFPNVGFLGSSSTSINLTYFESYMLCVVNSSLNISPAFFLIKGLEEGDLDCERGVYKKLSCDFEQSSIPVTELQPELLERLLVRENAATNHYLVYRILKDGKWGQRRNELAANKALDLGVKDGDLNCIREKVRLLIKEFKVGEALSVYQDVYLQFFEAKEARPEEHRQLLVDIEKEDFIRRLSQSQQGDLYYFLGEIYEGEKALDYYKKGSEVAHWRSRLRCAEENSEKTGKERVWADYLCKAATDEGVPIDKFQACHEQARRLFEYCKNNSSFLLENAEFKSNAETFLSAYMGWVEEALSSRSFSVSFGDEDDVSVKLKGGVFVETPESFKTLLLKDKDQWPEFVPSELQEKVQFKKDQAVCNAKEAKIAEIKRALLNSLGKARQLSCHIQSVVESCSKDKTALQLKNKQRTLEKLDPEGGALKDYYIELARYIYEDQTLVQNEVAEKCLQYLAEEKSIPEAKYYLAYLLYRKNPENPGGHVKRFQAVAKTSGLPNVMRASVYDQLAWIFQSQSNYRKALTHLLFAVCLYDADETKVNRQHLLKSINIFAREEAWSDANLAVRVGQLIGLSASFDNAEAEAIKVVADATAKMEVVILESENTPNEDKWKAFLLEWKIVFDQQNIEPSCLTFTDALSSDGAAVAALTQGAGRFKPLSASGSCEEKAQRPTTA